jgi:hypothetical protein
MISPICKTMGKKTHQYYKLSKDYPPPNPIPESVVAAAAGINAASESLKSTSSPKPAFMTGATVPSQVPHPDPSAQRLADHERQQQQLRNSQRPESRHDNVIEMVPGVSETPKGKRYDRRTKHPRASAQALGQGIRKLLLLITTLIVAKILNDERAAMTDKEASILGSALGNLLEPTPFNDQFGWLIADTGDYQAIGYVLIMYGSRINDIVQERRRAAASGQQARYSSPAPTAPPPSSNGAVRNNTPGALMPMKPNLKSPPGIHPGYGG